MKEEKKKLIITTVVSVLLSIVLEIILVVSNTSVLSIDRMLVVMSLVFIIAIHIVMDKSKLYDFILKHRFKIAAIVFMITVIFGISFVSFNEESI